MHDMSIIRLDETQRYSAIALTKHLYMLLRMLFTDPQTQLKLAVNSNSLLL